MYKTERLGLLLTPEEWKRWLSRVYTILLDLAAQQEAAERASAARECSPVMEGTLAAWIRRLRREGVSLALGT